MPKPWQPRPVFASPRPSRHHPVRLPDVALELHLLPVPGRASNAIPAIVNGGRLCWPKSVVDLRWASGLQNRPNGSGVTGRTCGGFYVAVGGEVRDNKVLDWTAYSEHNQDCSCAFLSASRQLNDLSSHGVEFSYGYGTVRSRLRR